MKRIIRLQISELMNPFALIFMMFLAVTLLKMGGYRARQAFFQASLQL